MQHFSKGLRGIPGQSITLINYSDSAISMDKSYVLVVIAAIFYGLITVGGEFFVRLGLSAHEIALYSTLVVSLVLLPFIIINKKFRIKKDMIFFFIIFGLINAMQEFTQFGALAFGVPVAVVALLLYSQPVWTTIFAYFFLKEKITITKIIAVLLCVIGIIILIKPWDISSIGSFTGILLAIIGGISLSLWVLWARKSGIEDNHYMTTTFGSVFFTFLWLLIAWPILHFLIPVNSLTGFTMPSIMTVVYMIIFALLASIFPHSLFFHGVRKISASTSGIILLLEPISATLLSALFFVQIPGMNVLLGGLFIIIANFIVILKEKN